MLCDDPLADRKSNATSWILISSMEPPENLKNILGGVRNANAIVADSNLPFAVFLLSINGYLRLTVRVAELDSIADQVLKHLHQLDIIADHLGKLAYSDFRVILGNDLSEIILCR
ncbi:hypothetical protein amb0991 [Paramagnetospirillum magneticum AMB-1]|uniref:Uncharacterized protein n=1 Tax=Paramagnetospirillum magneticum (strain ATCC 700264 / AMB-1) TaxID=342108 RepID=Q2W8N0_PARM1|nr:hypothetical protein amb0991 [Paramagnetospirillum magneticum AMB-1]